MAASTKSWHTDTGARTSRMESSSPVPASSLAFAQAADPLGTVTLPRTTLDVVESNNPGVLLGGASTLEEVVEVLNVLGATPRDMIAILEAMLDGQLLIADLRRI